MARSDDVTSLKILKKKKTIFFAGGCQQRANDQMNTLDSMESKVKKLYSWDTADLVAPAELLHHRASAHQETHSVKKKSEVRSERPRGSGAPRRHGRLIQCQ